MNDRAFKEVAEVLDFGEEERVEATTATEPDIPESAPESKVELLPEDYATIARFKQMDDFESYLSSFLYVSYNTTAVRIDELRALLVKRLDSDTLSALGDPVFYAALRTSDSIVADCVKTAVESWDNQETYSAVRTYFQGRGKVFSSDEEMLRYAVSQLPDSSIANEDSPEVYKAFKIVQLLNAEKKAGTVQSVGRAVGKLASVKYDTMRSFNDAVQEGLGSNAADFKADRERRRQQRELKKQREAEEEEQWEREQERLRRQQAASQQYAQHTTQTNPQYGYDRLYHQPNSAYGYRQPVPPQRYQSGRDFSPQIPPAYMAVGVNVLFLLLLYIANPTAAACSSIGLCIASIGLFQARRQKPATSKVRPWQLILLGYVSAIFGLFITV